MLIKQFDKRIEMDAYLAKVDDQLGYRIIDGIKIWSFGFYFNDKSVKWEIEVFSIKGTETAILLAHQNKMVDENTIFNMIP